MNVRVEINASRGSLEFERRQTTVRAITDGDARDYRAAADELERIAAEIRRMYPEVGK